MTLDVSLPLSPQINETLVSVSVRVRVRVRVRVWVRVKVAAIRQGLGFYNPR